MPQSQTCHEHFYCDLAIGKYRQNSEKCQPGFIVLSRQIQSAARNPLGHMGIPSVPQCGSWSLHKISLFHLSCHHAPCQASSLKNSMTSIFHYHYWPAPVQSLFFSSKLMPSFVLFICEKENTEMVQTSIQAISSFSFL